MERISEKWNLKRDVQFNTKIVALEWQEDEGKWKIGVETNGQRRDEFADVVISAQGFLKYVSYLALPQTWHLQHLVLGSGQTYLASMILKVTRSTQLNGIIPTITRTNELDSSAMALLPYRSFRKWPS